MTGDGRLSTTVAGLMMTTTAGSGFPVMNGDRHGLTGVPEVVITDGLRWDLA
ncbi:hypothetical protein D3C87_2107790 [compost metagenome]